MHCRELINTNLENIKSLFQHQLYLIKTPLSSLREATQKCPPAHSLQWPAYLLSFFMETVGPLISVRKRFRCQRDTKNTPMLHLPYWTHLDGIKLHLCMTVRFLWQYFNCKLFKVESRYCCWFYLFSGSKLWTNKTIWFVTVSLKISCLWAKTSFCYEALKRFLCSYSQRESGKRQSRDMAWRRVGTVNDSLYRSESNGRSVVSNCEN